MTIGILEPWKGVLLHGEGRGRRGSRGDGGVAGEGEGEKLSGREGGRGKEEEEKEDRGREGKEDRRRC